MDQVNQKPDDPGADARIRVPDPALMRRAGTRMVIALVIVLVLATFFTAGGVSLTAAGELPGLPLAIGGAVVQLALVIIVVAVIRIRRTLTGQTIARSALTSARRTAIFVRRLALAAIAGLLAYALVRVILGDRWTLLTAVFISIPLWVVATGARRLRIAYDHSLSQPS